ncbi:tetratricopeptide repeat protein [Bacteroidales bacterium AH-315-I05]|nr:tetratricopeptide repeat protein [Bacteroidales bacterium AH-315-I05]
MKGTEPNTKLLRNIRIGLFLFAFALYCNTIPNEYNLDDHLVVDESEMVQKGFGGLYEIFTTNYMIVKDVKMEYRPLVKATYAIEHEFFDKNPHISHLINVLLYAFTGIILFNLLCFFFSNYNVILPLLITLLFLAHPIHTEVVASLKNREELLSFLCGLLTIKFCADHCRLSKIKFLIFGCVAFLIGLLSKMTILTIFGIIPLLFYFFQISSIKKTAVVLSAIAAVAIGYYTFVGTMLPSWNREYVFLEMPIAFEEKIATKTASICLSLGHYLKLLFFPHPLSFYYGYNQIPLVGWSNIWAILSFLFYTFIVWFSFKNIKKRNVVALGILIFLFFIFPFSNIPYGYTGIISERALYAASLGFCITIAYLILKLTNVDFKTRGGIQFNKNLILIAVVIFGLFGFKTIDRNFDWKDKGTLYTADIGHLENSAKAHQLCAQFLQTDSLTSNMMNAKKLNQKIFYHYKRSVEIYDGWPTTLKNLGVLYASHKGETKKAISLLKKALKLKSNYPEASYNLALCYQAFGQMDSAVYFYEKTLEDYENHFSALNNLALHYFSKPDFKKARNYNNQFLKAFPDAPEPHINAATFYLAEKDTASAVPHLEKAVEINPNNPNAIALLSDYFERNGTTRKANYYRKLLKE